MKRIDELRELRLQKRLTQAEVAKKLKVSQSYYSQVERGEKRDEIFDAMQAVNLMSKKTGRTVGGDRKAGRSKI